MLRCNMQQKQMNKAKKVTFGLRDQGGTRVKRKEMGTSGNESMEKMNQILKG